MGTHNTMKIIAQTWSCTCRHWHRQISRQCHGLAGRRTEAQTRAETNRESERKTYIQEVSRFFADKLLSSFPHSQPLVQRQHQLHILHSARLEADGHLREWVGVMDGVHVSGRVNQITCLDVEVGLCKAARPLVPGGPYVVEKQLAPIGSRATQVNTKHIIDKSKWVTVEVQEVGGRRD